MKRHKCIIYIKLILWCPRYQQRYCFCGYCCCFNDLYSPVRCPLRSVIEWCACAVLTGAGKVRNPSTYRLYHLLHRKDMNLRVPCHSITILLPNEWKTVWRLYLSVPMSESRSELKIPKFCYVIKKQHSFLSMTRLYCTQPYSVHTI